MIVALLTRTGTIDVALKRACACHTVIVKSCSAPSECTTAAACADLVLVEPRDASGQCTAGLVRSIRQRRAEVPIAVYCALNASATRDLVELVKAGADEAVFIGFDDPSTWIQALAKTIEQRDTTSALLEELRSSVAPAARELVAYCLSETTGNPTVAGAARRLRVNRKTLVNRMTMAGLPAPGICVAWCRLLLAMSALERTGAPLERVALEHGFGSAAALRKMCRRYTELRVADLRGRGGTRHLVHLFLGSFGSLKRASECIPTTPLYRTAASSTVADNRALPTR